MGVVEQLLTMYNLIFCLAVVAIVWIQRKGVEITVKTIAGWAGKSWNLKDSKVWTEFLVPLGPLGAGALLTLIPQMAIPEMFATGMLNRMVFGLGMGLLSGLVYRLLKKNLLDKMGKSDEETTYEK